MLEYQSFVYLDLQKTGCTFLRDKLIGIVDAPVLNDCKHAPLEKASAKPKIITVRSPHQYYLSLWKYGLDGEGWFYNVAHKSIPFAFSEMSPKAFRCFLGLALFMPPQPDMHRSTIDLYTGRIIDQLVPLSDKRSFFDDLAFRRDSEALWKLLEPYTDLHFLRTESLNQDFHFLIKRGDLKFIPLRSDWESVFPLDAQPENTSFGKTSIDHPALLDEVNFEMIEEASYIPGKLCALARQSMN